MLFSNSVKTVFQIHKLFMSLIQLLQYLKDASHLSVAPIQSSFDDSTDDLQIMLELATSCSSWWDQKLVACGHAGIVWCR